VRQQNPDGLAHGAGQVGDACVGGDNQIKHGYESCCFGQVAVVAGAVQNRNVTGQRSQLFGGRAFLQRNPGDAGSAQQRQKCGQLHRTLAVGFVAGIARPTKAHSVLPL